MMIFKVDVPNYLVGFTFHPDIDRYLYFADSPRKNYEYNGIDKLLNIQVLSGNLTSGLHLYGDEEPSALYTSFKVVKCRNMSKIGIISHYPRYRALNPKQRYCFLKFLENPYQKTTPAFSCLLLYCLERHLSEGDESVIPVIIKLADSNGDRFKKDVYKMLDNYKLWKTGEVVRKVFNNYTLHI